MVTRIGWAVVIVGFLFVASADAQTWDGGGAAGGAVTWSTPTNWNPDVVPANNGTANIVMAGTIDTTKCTMSNPYMASVVKRAHGIWSRFSGFVDSLSGWVPSACASAAYAMSMSGSNGYWRSDSD